jgi:hypothetical protein
LVVAVAVAQLVLFKLVVVVAVEKWYFLKEYL